MTPKIAKNDATSPASDRAADDSSDSANGGSGGTGQGSVAGGAPSPAQIPPAGDTDNLSGQPASETGNATSGEIDNSQPDRNDGSRTDGNPETDSQGDKSAMSPPETASTSDKPGAGKGDPQGKSLIAYEDDDSDALASSLTGRANSPAKISQSSDSQRGREMGEADNEKEREIGAPKESSVLETETENARYRYRKQGGSGRVSTTAKKSFGGVTAEMKRKGVSLRLIKKARSILARLLEGGETQSGPRYDWVEFTKRLKTGRSVYPARKEEEGRPAILVLADVSGSCSSFSGVSLLVAQAIGKLGVSGSDVVVISHSNGYPQEWQVNGGNPQEIDWTWGDDPLPWYTKNLKKFNIQAVVALGDWDAEYLYRWVAAKSSVTKLVWLDNWSSNVMNPTVRGDLFRKANLNDEVYFDTPWSFSAPWSRQAKSKTTYVVGCGNADDFLAGLQLGLK